VTSAIRTLTDGARRADIIVTFDVGPRLMNDVRIEGTGLTPETYTNLLASPLRVYCKPTGMAIQVRIRRRHPISNVASTWSNPTSHTTVS